MSCISGPTSARYKVESRLKQNNIAVQEPRCAGKRRKARGARALGNDNINTPQDNSRKHTIHGTLMPRSINPLREVAARLLLALICVETCAGVTALYESEASQSAWRSRNLTRISCSNTAQIWSSPGQLRQNRANLGHDHLRLRPVGRVRPNLGQFQRGAEANNSGGHRPNSARSKPTSACTPKLREGLGWER